MITKIASLLKLPLYEKYNYISIQAARLKTQFFYRCFFRSIGGKSAIKNPLMLKYVNHVSIGRRVFVRDHVRIECVKQKGEQHFSPHLVLEDDVSMEQRCHVTVAGTLVIGKNSVIAADVMITDIDHEYGNISIPIMRQPLTVKKTAIGKNCFIGMGAKIQAGTILGDHCIVGSNAVVRGVFPDRCVIVGVPAKIVKRFDQGSGEWKKAGAAPVK